MLYFSPMQDSPRYGIQSDPGILGGSPVFAGTRVPARALLEYVQAGHSVEEFLADFPSVTREHLKAVLEEPA